MKYFIDTEFIEKPGTIQLISIGIVCENGDTLYEISNEFNEADANDWVKENVISKLDERQRLPNSLIALRVLSFIATTQGLKVNAPEFNYDFTGCSIEFWGYYSDYDWVVFCWLFGTMMDLPKGFPMYCLDLKQKMEHYKLTKEWKKEACPDSVEEHNALVDAQWNLNLNKAIEERIGKL